MADESTQATLSNLSTESRSFPPSEEFAAQANATAELYDGPTPTARRSGPSRPTGCTGTPIWDQVLDWRRRRSRSGSSAASSTSPTTASTGTSRTATASRSRSTGRASPATPAPSPTPTCKSEVCKTANALVALGLQAGDRVAIHLPMIPEAVFAMLACARLGAAHSVVFGGFSPRRCASGSTTPRRSW